MSTLTGTTRRQGASIVTTLPAEVVRRLGIAPGQQLDWIEPRWVPDEGADLADFAAAYLVGFVRSQGFSDGNKRTGLAVALAFLWQNGFRLHVPGEEIYILTMRAAKNELGDAAIASHRYLRPSSLNCSI